MIRGRVTPGFDAVVRLRVRGPGGAEVDGDAVIDTGFTRDLALPPATVAALGLVRRSGGVAVLADGSSRPYGVYPAEVAWGNGWRPVLVSAIGDEPLAGMRLLQGHELRVAVVPGGAVEVTPLP